VRRIFLDTSALYAAADRSSERHADCAEAFDELVRSQVGLVTSALVLAELHALTLRRIGPAAALTVVDRLTDSLRVEVRGVTTADVDTAVDLLRSRPNRRYSLADAVSFELMHALGIDAVLTLDADFAAEGFTVLPRTA